ncbi:MAG: mycofactocin biosynthesis peptidyl-dipeptidase MftE [Actinobacteria bacterium]|nr:mycofactocin biosynthesis peptidyl-dipeptidase MftE [Actinomycetota bacterium]
MTRIADCTWPEIAEVAHRSDILICAGSLEQHGPHLPLDVDTVIGAELARRWARGSPDRLVAPALPLGASDEHLGFPGTISIGTSVTADLVIAAVRSCSIFRSVVVLSWHGGNADALAVAETILVSEGRHVSFWRPSVPGDAHAGRIETSIMLAIAPDRVRLHLAAPGTTDSLASLMSTLRSDGVRSVSPSGVLGDPTGASPEEGEALLDAVLQDRKERVE